MQAAIIGIISYAWNTGHVGITKWKWEGDMAELWNSCGSRDTGIRIDDVVDKGSVDNQLACVKDGMNYIILLKTRCVCSKWPSSSAMLVCCKCESQMSVCCMAHNYPYLL